MADLKIHPKVTLEVVQESVERRHSSTDDPGFCIACGEAVDGVEGDTHGEECESCGAPHGVYGDEELLIMLVDF